MPQASRTQAIVGPCRELRSPSGGSAILDLDPYVRAGSGLAWYGDRLLVLQDDVLSLGIFSPRARRTQIWALPSQDGVRRFSKAKGNKARKPDFEAALHLGPRRVLGFGSGSTRARESILDLTLPLRPGDPRQAKIRSVPGFYQMLRDSKRFSGSELNLEGAVLFGDEVVLLQRGNGAPKIGLLPVNALGFFPRKALVSFLEAPDSAPLPDFEILSLEIGNLQGVPLSFTAADHSPSGRGISFLASAEASPNTYDDGEVVGTVLGWVDREGQGSWTPLKDAQGELFCAKAEGLLLQRTGEHRYWISLDVDATDQACQVCEVTVRNSEP